MTNKEYTIDIFKKLKGQHILINNKVLRFIGIGEDQYDFLFILWDGKKVISFSVGIHICLGRELAKLETRVALRALKKRFPNLKLINNGQRVGPFLFWGRSKLPVSHN